VIKEIPELLAHRVFWESKVKKVILVPQVPMEQMEMTEPLARLVQPELMVPKESKVFKVPMVLMEQTEMTEQPEQLVFRESKV